MKVALAVGAAAAAAAVVYAAYRRRRPSTSSTAKPLKEIRRADYAPPAWLIPEQSLVLKLCGVAVNHEDERGWSPDKTATVASIVARRLGRRAAKMTGSVAEDQEDRGGPVVLVVELLHLQAGPPGSPGRQAARPAAQPPGLPGLAVHPPA